MKDQKHALAWFEIPASDIKRAKAFYENIFDVELAFMDLGDNFKMAVFPGDMESVSGAVIYNPNFYHPNDSQGPLLYLNANPDLQIVQDKIEAAGGKVTIPKRQISPDHGYMAVFLDSEGNRVALHSQQ
jgi:predicted enzyme related to lactoylglutathione lyase